MNGFAPGAFFLRLIIGGLLMPSLLCLFGCGQGEPKPVDLLPEDMCALCKMAISEKRFASEIIDYDREPLKFDDLSCMLRHLEAHPEQVNKSTRFVVDFESGGWVKAEDAAFVRAPEFKTPMGGNIAAFLDSSKAGVIASQYHTQVLRFDSLLQPPATPADSAKKESK